jgi:hypothetical protein
MSEDTEAAMSEDAGEHKAETGDAKSSGGDGKSGGGKGGAGGGGWPSKVSGKKSGVRPREGLRSAQGTEAQVTVDRRR